MPRRQIWTTPMFNTETMWQGKNCCKRLFTISAYHSPFDFELVMELELHEPVNV